MYVTNRSVVHQMKLRRQVLQRLVKTSGKHKHNQLCMLLVRFSEVDNLQATSDNTTFSSDSLNQ